MQGQTNLTASGDYSSLIASLPWPEEDANITAVGGTVLFMAGQGAGGWNGESSWSSSAGGVSLDHRILIEPYQLPYITKDNEGSPHWRNVPDVAANAEWDMYVCANGGCEGGWGGTSFSSPIWAGYIALANEYAVKHGKPVVGFINPLIYSLGHAANYGDLFHDILVGKSGRYHATSSYDLVTGLGSPRGLALIKALAQ